MKNTLSLINTSHHSKQLAQGSVTFNGFIWWALFGTILQYNNYTLFYIQILNELSPHVGEGGGVENGFLAIE